MVIIPDLPLVAILTIPFLIALVGLHFILFKPLMDYLDERDKASSGARAEAGRLTGQIEDRLATLDDRLKAARAEVNDLRKAARERAASKEHEILADAREQAENKVETALARIGEERKAASKTMKDTAQALSSPIAARVLGRELQA